MAFDERQLSRGNKETYLLGESLIAMKDTRAWKFIKQKLLDAYNEAGTETIDLKKTAEEVKVDVSINQFKRLFIVELQDDIQDAIDDSNQIKIDNS